MGCLASHRSSVIAEEMLRPLILFAKILWVFFDQASCQLQFISTPPSNLDVPQGERAVLQCRVSHQEGDVQWSKNGLLMGFNRTIAGFPRFSMVSDGSQGIHDLVIQNVHMEDEGVYRCQVSPTPGQNSDEKSANLTVLLPATSIEILGYQNGSRVKVNQSQSLTLKCDVRGAKPAAKIIWYRYGIQLSEALAQYDVTNESEYRYTGHSKLTLNPQPHDNGAVYTCESSHQAMAKPLRYKVLLDVLFAPGYPVIEGYREGETIRVNDAVILRCVSKGGNPGARLIWKKNGVNVDYSYITTDRESVNVYNLVANVSDDGARYTCSASSLFSLEPMDVSVVFTVLYAPSKVTIRGSKEAKAGDVVTLTCSTDKSNPASDISWVVDGRPVASVNEVEGDRSVGWKTSSQVTVNITQQERSMKLFSCYAVNHVLGETVVGTFSISILYAPDPPGIFGYSEGTAIQAGSLQRLTCASHGGNPLPKLRWFKGDQKISEVKVTSNGNIVSGEITVIASDSDNGAQYRCETSNLATPNPLTATIALTVHFPPSEVTINVKPKKPKAGHKVTMNCDSASSNPPANVTWLKEGVVLEPSRVAHAEGSHGGTVTKSTITLNVTAEDDGSIFTCQATNEALQQSVHDAITLIIYYKPAFSQESILTYEVTEGSAFFVNLTSQANPREVTYIWMKDNETIWEGSTVNVSSIQRNNTGNYILRATNEMGISEVTVIIVVLYPVSVQTPNNMLEKDRGSDARLECVAQGYPLPANVITWKRDSYDMKKTKTYVNKGQSTLSIINVSKDDSGEFTCVGKNGIGKEDKKTIMLLVRHEPIIQSKQPVGAKVLSDRETSASLECIAEGVPNVSFTWYKEGVAIKENNKEMEQQTSQVNPTTWKGTLTIKKVQTKDFGEYSCVARNSMGFNTVGISLEADGSPDPPLAVKITNISYDSMHLSWVPGFDGGNAQSYRIRYQSAEAPSAIYLDVHPLNATSVWVTGLTEDLLYSFSVMSINSRGPSGYSTDIVKAKTSTKPTVGKPKMETPKVNGIKTVLSELFITTFVVVFLVLFLLNIVLLALYYRKKRLKKASYSRDATTSSGSDSESDTPKSEVFVLSDYSSSLTKQSSSSISEEFSFQEKTSSDTESSADSYEDSPTNDDSSQYESAHTSPVGYFV